MNNIIKLIKTPHTPSTGLTQHSPMAPQIMLYFGVAKAVAQIKIFFLFCTSWNFVLKRFFSYNIHASRAWDWLGTPMSKDTADK